MALTSALALAAGCGGHGTPVRNAKDVGNEVAAQSQAVLDMTGVKGEGKVTGGGPPDGGPDEVSCDYDNDDDPNREMLQMWSLYDVDNTTLGKAMADLAADLPKQGWKVVRNAPDSSMARNQEIEAVHTATRTQLEATWKKRLDGGDPLIIFNVYSRCFRTADGAEDGS